jgi:Flp pilus assembly protein CpaB
MDPEERDVAAQKRSNNLIIVLGVLTAVVGAGLVLLLAGRGGGGDSASGGGSGDTVPVLVAKKAIPVGAVGSDIGDLVEVRQVPAVTRSSDALVSLGELADRTTTVAVGPEQQLRSAFFRQRTQRGDAIKVPEGKQAVSVSIPFVNAGGGYIGAGDHVNVYALVGRQNGNVVPLCGEDKGLCPGGGANGPQAISQLVMSNVEVLDISREIAPTTVTPVEAETGGVTRTGGDQRDVNVLMLMALDASQAERAIFFSGYGNLYVTLMPQGQPDSTTGGRDQTNVLKP